MLRLIPVGVPPSAYFLKYIQTCQLDHLKMISGQLFITFWRKHTNGFITIHQLRKSTGSDGTIWHQTFSSGVSSFSSSSPLSSLCQSISSMKVSSCTTVCRWASQLNGKETLIWHIPTWQSALQSFLTSNNWKVKSIIKKGCQIVCILINQFLNRKKEKNQLDLHSYYVRFSWGNL